MDSKLRELLEAAIIKTDRGGLVWTAFDSETFRTKIDPGYLHIYRTQFRDEASDFTGVVYLVQVTDAQGRVVMEDNVEEEVGEDGELFKLFDHLFQVARKSALGSERVIEEMLHTLRGDSRVPAAIPPTPKS